MMESYETIIDDLEERLEVITENTIDNKFWIQEALKTSLEYHSLLKKRFLSQKELSPEQEIHFFKHFKPRLLQRVIYYTKLLQIWHIEAYNLNSNPLECYQKYLLEFINFNTQELEFIKYIDSDQSHFDIQYFHRQSNISHTMMSLEFRELDIEYTTGYDILSAQILANRNLEAYLNSRIRALSMSLDIQKESALLKWTGSKIDLIELIYALQASGYFNSGRATIQDITDLFQHSFQINLDQKYRIYSEIKNRQGSYSKALDHMQKMFKKKVINDLD